MKKQILIGIIAAVSIAAAAPVVMAVGESSTATAPEAGVSKMKMEKKNHYQAPESRQEAVQRAKEHVSKLEAMTDKEWLDQREKRKNARKAGKKGDKRGPLTAEERQKLKEKFKAQQKQ